MEQVDVEKMKRLQAFTAGPSQDLEVSWGIPVRMQRLDLISSWASGNKYYKLKEYFRYAISHGYTALVSKGGMFSNHLDALVQACRTFHLSCQCIIRSYGADPDNPSTTRWESEGAELIYMEPGDYQRFDMNAAASRFPNSLFIPEGGGGLLGIRGAATLWDDLDTEGITHVAIAGGSMTTAIGLLFSAPVHIKIIIVSAWKNCAENYLDEMLAHYEILPECQFEIWNEYHFGGFGRYTKELIEFMHQFTSATNIPLDPVYTGKLMFAIKDRCSTGYLNKTDHVLAIHTGGLQGVEGFSYRDAALWSTYAAQVKELA